MIRHDLNYNWFSIRRLFNFLRVLDSLNTNQFEADSAPSYYSVFTRRPKVYTYAPSSKDIPREEDVIEDSISQEEHAMNEVCVLFICRMLYFEVEQEFPGGKNNEIGANAEDLGEKRFG